MSLDNLFISDATQDLYAEIVAIEDISEGNETDNELLKSNDINIGEIKHELY